MARVETPAGAVCASGDDYIYEYVKNCNPELPPIPVLALPPESHQTGASRVIPFDLSAAFGVDYPATSPNLLAAYIRVLPGETVVSQSAATSQAFFVIRGKGVTRSADFGSIEYGTGDLFVLPATSLPLEHQAGSEGDLALYHVTDEPLLKYLGAIPAVKKFEPTFFTWKKMVEQVEEIRHDKDAAHKNRLGILLGNKATDKNTKTLTHTLWSLLNLLPAHTSQPPHRHNSVALDLAVVSADVGVYTLMGPELGPDGWVKNPMRVEWKSGGAFVTPPGWWHSHHNDSGEDAWVLPLQDAGLHTHMRSLDIRFSKVSAEATA